MVLVPEVPPISTELVGLGLAADPRSYLGQAEEVRRLLEGVHTNAPVVAVDAVGASWLEM